MITLDEFLRQQEKLPESNRLSESKIRVLKLSNKFADEVYKIDQTWYFVFNEGSYQGSYEMSLNQKNLSSLKLLNILIQI